MGVAEQNMTGLATGMALEGHIVFTYSIANFPTLRCLEQIRNDVCYHDANVKIVAIGGGFSYGALGISHHATEDIAIMRALPGMTVVRPATSGRSSTRRARLGRRARVPAPRQVSTAPRTNSASEALPAPDGPGDGTGAVHASRSSPAAASWAKRSLPRRPHWAAQGIAADRRQPAHASPIPHADCLVGLGRTNEAIVTVEEHVLRGGLGSAVAEECLPTRMRCLGKFCRIGIRGRDFVSVVGSQDYLRERYAMGADAIAKTVRAMLGAER